MFKRLFLTFICCTMLWSCSSEEVIPEKTMAHIYRDIYLTDLYIATDLATQKAADTLKVYESVCQKYGYTSEDFVRSVEYYLQSPADFADLLKPAYAALKKREKELEKEIARLDNLNTRWTLLDTLPKMADRRILGNSYYRALYQIFYQPDTLIYRSPVPDTAKLNAPWTRLLLYTTPISNVPGHVPYVFGVEWFALDPELIQDPWRWNYRKTLPAWYLIERDKKDSVRFIQDSIRREQVRIRKQEDSIRRSKRMEDIQNIRNRRNPNQRPDPKKTNILEQKQKFNPVLNNKEDRHRKPLQTPTKPQKK